MENSVPAAESDSGQVKQKIHDPEGIEPETIFFHEAQVRELILEYQREPKPETWQAIVNGTLPLIESLIRQHNFCAYEDPDALKNECILKLFKTIRHYDPARPKPSETARLIRLRKCCGSCVAQLYCPRFTGLWASNALLA